MARTLDEYLSRVTSEHNQQPNFMQTLTDLITPLAEMQAFVEHLPLDFDLDYAVGVQLDAIGVRVNRDRFIQVPLNLYFTVGDANLGVGQGILKGPHDPDTGQAILPDEPYRVVLRAVIAANQWDGTIPGAYAVYDILLQAAPVARRPTILIQDYGDLSYALVLLGDIAPGPVAMALFLTDELNLKPAGIKLYRLMPATFPGGTPASYPVFGVGMDTDMIAGVGAGVLIKTIAVE